MIFYPIWRIILAGFLLKRVRWGGLIYTAADFLPLRLLAESPPHCSSCPEGKVLYGNSSPRAVTVKCPPESQLAWAAAPLCAFVPSGMCGFSKWRPPFVLALFQAWMIALVEPSLSTRGGEKAGWREKNSLSHGLYSSRLWVFIPLDLMEFYFLSVWKFGKKSQW